MSHVLARLKIIFKNAGIWKLILFFLGPTLLSPIIIYNQTASAKAGFILILVTFFLVVEIVPLSATALMAICLMALTGVQGTAETAKTFATETFFLLTSVLILAISIEETMLHNRLALLALRIIGVSPSKLILGFLLISGLLSMWMSNTAVALMILPIAMAVSKSLTPDEPEDEEIPLGIPIQEQVRRLSVSVDRLHKKSTGNISQRSFKVIDYIETPNDMADVLVEESTTFIEEKGSQYGLAPASARRMSLKPATPKWQTEIGKALQLSTAYGANIGGMATLIGAYPNMVMKINVEKIYGMETSLNFTTFFLVAAPIAILSLIASWIVLSVIFVPGWIQFWKRKLNDTTKTKGVMATLDDRLKELGPMRESEITVSCIFLTVVILWLLRDPRVFPGWAAILRPGCASDSVPAMLGALLLFILPVSGKDLYNGNYAPILTWKRVVTKFPWELLLFVGGLTSITSLADKSGLMTSLAKEIPDLRSLPPLVVATGVSLLASFLTEIMSGGVLTAILTPILANVAEDMGVNPLYFMLAATISSQFAFMVPISSFPTMIIKSAGSVTNWDMAKAGFGPKVVCTIMLILGLEILGILVFDIRTFPDWAEAHLRERHNTFLVTNDTSSSVRGILANVTVLP
ncbi:Solute carrier family 13 member 1 [Hypsibius exemplaris]|uniref:Solute carrier family 13 member 1 n=1 Tax=Hypsibius exemplaris TaxID=2072580 RepID=A0A1W0XDA0_HYPEX|nr:Solute carrier family 13 member 1 [Hypsibius exemplaris]